MKNTTHTILTFLKFGETEHIQDMYENGTLYLNSIDYFKKLENDKLRGDKYEAISKIHNSRNGTFEIKSLNFKGNYIKLHIKEGYESYPGNIYCLYCISSAHIKNPLKFKFNPKILEFGPSCLMVHKNEIFLEKIRVALRQQKFNFEMGFVKYYNKNQKNGDLTLFHKSMEFKYQNEFRIHVQSGSFEPLKIELGSLKDIAEIYDTKEMIDKLEIVNNCV